MPKVKRIKPAHERYEKEQKQWQPIVKLKRVTIENNAYGQAKVRRLAQNTTALNLCNLPAEILEKIIGHVNIWHHNRIRATSKRMRAVDDIFIMHEFNKALDKHTRINPTSFKCAALKCIKLITEVYVHEGFVNTFCGCILPMLRTSYKDPFSPNILQINKFLVHFYETVDELIGDSCSQYSRLLYNLTLMRFLKHFKKSTIISSTAISLHWRVVVELKGSWLGILWTSKTRQHTQPIKRSHLLVILAEMLLANIMNKAFKRVWESPNEIYVYGYDSSNNKRLPKTIFTFTVHGSKRICQLFRNCLESDAQDLTWPVKWPKDQFTVNLDIHCKEAMKWGCSKSQHMEFGPFAQGSYSENEEEEE